jgi:uncharacterized protein YdeI (YjbR/CyaY-like superfamily)
MSTVTLPSGTVHTIPKDLQKAVVTNATALTTWNSITPLARNEWICLVDSAKQDGTRERRIKRAQDQLSRGQRRPCCWTGCPHREKNGK